MHNDFRLSNKIKRKRLDHFNSGLQTEVVQTIFFYFDSSC